MLSSVVTGWRSEVLAGGRDPSESLHSRRRCPAGFCLVPRPLLLAAAMVILAAPAADAQGRAGSESGQPVRRYLFVVETSRAMQRRSQGVHDTLKALLDSNLNGQMRPNDSVAVWTFNETISTNFFSGATWSTAARTSLSARLPAFLEGSTYEKRAALEKVVPRLEPQIATEDLLTVILITTGEEEVQGTPFDNQLKRSFSQWRADQQKARMPILTLLRGSRGRFNQWSVTAAPWPLEIPPLELVVPTTRLKTNDAPKPSSSPSMANSAKERTNSPPPNIAQTNLALATTNHNTAALTNSTWPVVMKTNEVASANPPPAVLSATDPNTSNEALGITNAPAVPVESPKTNMLLAATGDPTAGQIPPVSDSTEHPTTIAFSADVPRREEATQAHTVTATQVDAPLPTPAAAPSTPANQPTNSSPPATTAAAADPISATVSPNLIPPVAEPPSKSTQMAMTDPLSHSFIHENAKWIVGACVSAIAAIFCVLLWLSTYSRNQLNLATLPKNKKPER
jgi:hypothetical protein